MNVYLSDRYRWIFGCERGGCLLALLATTAFPIGNAQVALEPAHLSSTLYFSSAASEAEDRAALHARVPLQIQAIRISSLPSLVRRLDHCEALIGALQTHNAYLKVRTLENVEDHASQEAREQVRTDQSKLEAAMKVRLRRLPMSAVHSLGRYALLAERAKREAVHELAPTTEKYRRAVVLSTLSSLAALYDNLDGKINRPKELGASDTTTRRQAIAQLYDAYDNAAPEEALLLGTIMQVENGDAVAQGYTDAATRKYSELGRSDASVVQMLAALRAEAPVYKRYQEVLAKHAARKIGLSPVLPIEADLSSTKGPVLSLNDAESLIMDSLQPLGSDYTSRFRALLDPKNGRLDLMGGEHRARTGTSIDAYEVPTALYDSGYDGSLGQVGIIAHEGGHAIHRELMNTSGSPLYERSGPSFFYEGYAVFNELLVLSHAAEVASTSSDKEYALENLLSELSLEIFVSAEETTFERSLYLSSSKRHFLLRSQVDSLYRDAVAPYEYWPADEVSRSANWMGKELLFRDPLYLVSYLYASLIAVALYEKSQSDPLFADKYEAVLRRGFNVKSESILIPLGIQLDDPKLVKAASRLLDEKTSELEALYAQDDAGGR